MSEARLGDVRHFVSQVGWNLMEVISFDNPTVVVKANQPPFSTPFALKLMSDAREHYEEVTMLRYIGSHPNILPVIHALHVRGASS